MSRFDGVAGGVAGRVMARMNADMEDAALALLGPRERERFLVVGFGPGVGLELLLDTVVPARVLGVDPSRAMVEAARKRVARHPRGGCVELHQVPAHRIPPGQGFDAAVAVNCEQLWEPHGDSLRALAGALGPGGRLVSLTHTWAVERRQPVVEWKALVEAELGGAGFSPPVWSEARYRSGPALGYRTCHPGLEGPAPAR